MKVVSTIDTAHPTYVRICVEDGENVQELKKISMDDYIQLMNGSLLTSKRMERLGRLPEGFIDGGYNSTNGEYEAIIHVPGDKRPIFFQEQAHIVAFPSLVFYFRAERNRITKSLLYAVDDKEELSAESALYHYPYGNVYNDAHICWGQNKLPQITKLADFDSVVQMFFGAQTNNDLYQPPTVKLNGNEIKPAQAELISMMEKEQKFPVEILNPFQLKLKNL